MNRPRFSTGYLYTRTVHEPPLQVLLEGAPKLLGLHPYKDQIIFYRAGDYSIIMVEQALLIAKYAVRNTN